MTSIKKFFEKKKCEDKEEDKKSKEEKKYNIINNINMMSILEHEKKWKEENGHMYDWMCMNEIKTKCNDKLIDEIKKIENYVEGDIIYKHKLCVLQKNHKGKCSFSPHVKIFNEDKIHSKINTSIYETPGNDGYVFKNRSSRLYPIAIPCDLERKIKNKDIKLKCAIPIKEMSTPYFLACAFTDLITFILHMRDINKFVSDDIEYDEYKTFLKTHKINLEEYYKRFNRVVFNEFNFIVCPVTKKEILTGNAFVDNRINNTENDVQLGHCEPKNEYNVTIRGLNLLLMSRCGNRIVGDNNFLENKWINDLKEILKQF